MCKRFEAEGAAVTPAITLAVTVAAVLAAERDRDALVLVLAADHVIRKPEEFRDTCRSAASAAAEGRIVTFGIECGNFPFCAATMLSEIERFEPIMAEAGKPRLRG
jgi:hypothetical protein